MVKVVLERPTPTETPHPLTRLYSKLRNKMSGKDVIANNEGEDKPVEVIRLENLPDATHDHLAESLVAVVDHSSTTHDVSQNIHAQMFNLKHLPWVHKLIPGVEKL
jgi:hypothetical protein